MRLFSLQVLGHQDFRKLAENQHELRRTLIPARGEIFIDSGEATRRVPVVTNIEKNLVFAVPPEITDKQKTAGLLAPVLEMGRQDVMEKISQEERRWVPIKKQLSERESEAVQNLKLAGIYLEPETLRFYPEHEFASQVLGFYGFAGERRVGRYGLEEYFEKRLAGEPGSLFSITGGIKDIKGAKNGENINLTLNRAIQFKAESILKEAVDGNQAEGGSIVVLNPKSGAVLAIANYPSFDPNEFNKVEDQAVFKNRIVTDAYEPGSVFKPITMAGALEAEVVKPNETYEDRGVVVIGKHSIKNSDGKAHGAQTMTQVLEESLNTGAVFVQDKLGPERFLETVKKFGFGAKTGITLPAESAGDIGNLRGGGDIHYATAAFGQGITATPLQIASAFAAIANGGKLMKPYLVEGEGGPHEASEVISARAANTLSAMLVQVVENGHGKRAGVPGYWVAGKTGTAQVARRDGGAGYDPDVTIGTFAGFAPINDPVFAAVVRVDNPKTVRFAESTAAPAFGKLAQFLLNYYQVPPSRQ